MTKKLINLVIKTSQRKELSQKCIYVNLSFEAIVIIKRKRDRKK